MNSIILIILIILLNTIPFLISRQWDMSNPTWYTKIRLPQTPPGYVFSIVWTLLYTLMAIAVFIIYQSPESDYKWLALILFSIQYVLNISFIPLYSQGRIIISNYIILLTLITASMTTYLFSKLDTTAGLIMIPYLGWLIQALYFNNRLAERLLL